MAPHHAELLEAALLLLRPSGDESPILTGARLRRSISTAYYALFQFLVDEAVTRLVGSTEGQMYRRQILARTFSHRGMKTALDKVAGQVVDQSVMEFMRPPGNFSEVLPAPDFARAIAVTFSDAQAKRHDADYNLNRNFIELDAQVLIERIEQTISIWHSAVTEADEDFETSLCLLMLVKGQLRRDTG